MVCVRQNLFQDPINRRGFAALDQELKPSKGNVLVRVRLQGVEDVWASQRPHRAYQGIGFHLEVFLKDGLGNHVRQDASACGGSN